MRATHDGGRDARPLVPVYSLNSITLSRQVVATVTTPRRKTIVERVALLVLDGLKPFKFRVDVVGGLHVVGRIAV